MKPLQHLFDGEQLRTLTAAEPVRNFLTTSGLTKAPGLNLYDSAKLQAGRQDHWDTMSQAADADRDTYKQFLRGLANMTGAPRGPQFEPAIDAASKNIAKLSPYMMTVAPQLWDQLHGNRGSAAALASSISKVYPERSALENSALAQQVFKKLYGPGGTGAGGLSAGDIGKTYEAMNSQGLMGTRGGLDANQAATRLFHGGTAMRSLIDTTRDFPKASASLLGALPAMFGFGKKPEPVATKEQPPVKAPSYFSERPRKPPQLMRLLHPETAAATRESLEKGAAAAWRRPGNLNAVAKRVLGEKPAVPGTTKVVLSDTFHGRPTGDPVLSSAGRLPGAGKPVPSAQAVKQIAANEPGLVTRLIEGLGLRAEGNYPVYRGQAGPFTGDASMHVSPRSSVAASYAQGARGAIPGYAFLGEFKNPPPLKFYSHGGVRYSQVGKATPLSRHHIDAFEAEMPPARPTRSFLSSQNSGNAVETSGIEPGKLEKWYKSFTRP